MAAHIQNWQMVTFRQRDKTIRRIVYTRVVLWYTVSRKPIMLVISRELWAERIKRMFGICAVHDKKFEFLLEALAPAA